jgi:hypothetical protein
LRKRRHIARNTTITTRRRRRSCEIKDKTCLTLWASIWSDRFTHFLLNTQLVGAMNPLDLDAMDESIPLTKYALDQLLGYDTKNGEYSRYFDGFKYAQATRKIDRDTLKTERIDTLKKNYNWAPLLEFFMREKDSAKIKEVQDFKNELKAIQALQARFY